MTLTYRLAILTVVSLGATACAGGSSPTAHSFAGQASGTTISGTYTPVSSPYVCDGGIPLPLPPLVSGARIYSRQ